MEQIKLLCGVYGEATVFSVKIGRDVDVEALQEAIFSRQRYDHQYNFAASALTLYLARKDGAWLKHDRTVKTFLRGEVDTDYDEMLSSWKLDDEEYFGSSFQPIAKDIHILVKLPTSAGGATRQSGLWLVRGSIANALNTRGVCCRVYRLAGTYLGYYDPARRVGDKEGALWYEDKTLCIQILFKTEDNALRFENALQEEPVTLGSPLYLQVITTSVEQVVGAVPTPLRRIYFIHYAPEESESPQDAMSVISLTSSVTVLDASTDEFRYQRIEHERYFLPYGKAESCHLVSKKLCRVHKREYAKYDRDPNNRLALSREVHGYYDGLSYDLPIVNMIPGSVEQVRSVGNRYKVEVFVKVFDAQCKERVFSRLKDGTTETDDPLMMKTFVHVEDPETFCFCMRWKHAENDECWKSFLSMTPAVD